ncbi:MAG: hypothetical protein AAF386_10705 [Pseudomonadota bacterium]
MKHLVTAALVTLTMASSASAFGIFPIANFPTLWPQQGVFDGAETPTKQRNSK